MRKPFAMEQSLVLIADIESSKEIREEERETLQQTLQQTLTQINEQGDRGVLSPYTITLGDEFQAVYKNADHLFRHIFKILAELHPVKARFSIGIGNIATPINIEQAIGMDGPAFHEAREGVEQLKKSGFLFNLRIEEEESLLVKLTNGSLQLISDQMRSWNKKRISILYMLKKGFDYKAVTKELDISRTAFYKNKEAGSLDVISELTDNIAHMINKKLSS